VTEQRYKAVLAVIGEGHTVGEVARDWGVSRRTMDRWLARYEANRLEGLEDLSHRPAHCPRQIQAAVEVQLLEMRRAKPYWGARRPALELARKGAMPAPPKSAVSRCLVRAGVIDPTPRQHRKDRWKRWERGSAMELWQFDVVHGCIARPRTLPGALAQSSRISPLALYIVERAAGSVRPRVRG
jgi:transposase